ARRAVREERPPAPRYPGGARRRQRGRRAAARPRARRLVGPAARGDPRLRRRAGSRPPPARARLGRLKPLRRSSHDREILRLALPALATLAIEPLYILVDTAIVGHLGTAQLAGVGIAAAILGALFALSNFLT